MNFPTIWKRPLFQYICIIICIILCILLFYKVINSFVVKKHVIEHNTDALDSSKTDFTKQDNTLVLNNIENTDAIYNFCETNFPIEQNAFNLSLIHI